ncbi:hypothetical protein D3C81_846520 [compost metagenome]
MEGIINKDYYRCLTFQTENQVERLLRDKFIVSDDLYRVKREDKTDFYMNQLKDLGEDNYPLYAWAGIYYYEKLVHPIDAFTLANTWTTYMGYMQMSGLYLIEFDIQSDKCVLGKLQSIELTSLDECTDDNVEAVFSELKLDWVVGIYKPINTKGRYKQVTYEPIYQNGYTCIINEPIEFIGDCYPVVDGKKLNMLESIDYYKSFGWSEPIKGLPIEELERLMSDEGIEKFLEEYLVEPFSEELANSKWDEIKDNIYIGNNYYNTERR